MKITKLISAACVMSAVAFAAPVAAKTLKLASIAPEGSVWWKEANAFAEAVNASGADLTIEIYPAAQLGNMGDTLKNALSGRLDIWTGVLPVLAGVAPEVGLVGLPYMFESDAEVKCVAPKLLEPIRTAVGKKLHVLYVAPVGTQDVSATKPIHVPSDLQGIKIRTAPLPASMAFFKAAGATPQPLPGSETASALGTGLVDAVDFQTVYYVLTGSHKTAKYHTRTGHLMNLGAFAVSPSTWAGLTDAQRDAIQGAADGLDFAASWDAVKGLEGAMLQKAISEGAESIELSDAEFAQWVEAGHAVWDGVIADTRGDTAGFLAAIDQARASCK